jgi:ribonuclease VapC
VIVDTSALMAIVAMEDDAARYAEAMRAAGDRLAMSAATLVEVTMVAEGRGGEAMAARLDSLLDFAGIEVAELTARQASIAREGWRRFGKGRHKAALNLGDCFAYALAIERDEKLLFKGDDFAATDVKRAL